MGNCTGRKIEHRLDRDAVIVNAYAYRNAGDAAIMLSTIALLRDMGYTRITLSSRYSDRLNYLSEGVSIADPILPFSERSHPGMAPLRVVRLLVAVGVLFFLLAIKRWFPSAAARAGRRLLGAGAGCIGRDTLVVVAGGGYIYSSRRLFNVSLYHSLLTIRAAGVLARRVVMMPQSVGPLNRLVDAAIAQWALRAVERPILRESLSLTRSRRCLSLPNAYILPDIAFYRPSGVATRPEDLSSRTVRIVVMDWTWSSSASASGFNAYVRALAALSDAMLRGGFDVVLGGHSRIPEQRQDDILVCREVLALCTEQGITLDEECDVVHLYDEYARSALVVSTRLHGSIMAASVGTPTVALAYQEKAYGVLRGLECMVPVHQVESLQVETLVADCRRLLLSNDAGRVIQSATTGARERLRIEMGFLS